LESGLGLRPHEFESRILRQLTRGNPVSEVSAWCFGPVWSQFWSQLAVVSGPARLSVDAAGSGRTVRERACGRIWRSVRIPHPARPRTHRTPSRGVRRMCDPSASAEYRMLAEPGEARPAQPQTICDRHVSSLRCKGSAAGLLSAANSATLGFHLGADSSQRMGPVRSRSTADSAHGSLPTRDGEPNERGAWRSPGIGRRMRRSWHPPRA